MKPGWFAGGMWMAELVDAWRVVPRLLIGAYAAFVYKVVFFILGWYAAEPASARGAEESAVVGIVVTAVTGFAPWIFKIYSENGRDWSSQQSERASQ